MRPVASLMVSRGGGAWQLLVVAGSGDSGERRVVGQVGGRHRRWPTISVRQRVTALKRGDHVVSVVSKSV